MSSGNKPEDYTSEDTAFWEDVEDNDILKEEVDSEEADPEEADSGGADSGGAGKTAHIGSPGEDRRGVCGGAYGSVSAGV